MYYYHKSFARVRYASDRSTSFVTMTFKYILISISAWFDILEALVNVKNPIDSSLLENDNLCKPFYALHLYCFCSSPFGGFAKPTRFCFRKQGILGHLECSSRKYLETESDEWYVICTF